LNLSTLLRVPDIRERFTAEFPKPRIIIDRPILAPPRSKRYSLVGTAFDYLMRFHLVRASPRAKARRWVAEASVDHIASSAVSTSVYDIDSGVLTFPNDDGRRELGQKVVADAKKAYDRFLRDGVVGPALLKGVIHLAQLDAAYRSGFVYEDEDLGMAAAEDVRDLRNLISIVPWDGFRSSYRCLLNPTFAVESRFGGFGADADLVIDDLLIDIKTVKEGKLSREVFNQLMGYYTLHAIGGFRDGGRHRRIHRLGAYLARHGELVTFEVDSVVNPKTFPAFVRWFTRRVRLVRLRRK
jgi:hypothetical protein